MLTFLLRVALIAELVLTAQSAFGQWGCVNCQCALPPQRPAVDIAGVYRPVATVVLAGGQPTTVVPNRYNYSPVVVPQPRPTVVYTTTSQQNLTSLDQPTPTYSFQRINRGSVNFQMTGCPNGRCPAR